VYHLQFSLQAARPETLDTTSYLPLEISFLGWTLSSTRPKYMCIYIYIYLGS
jgi:hypothetical protein